MSDLPTVEIENPAAPSGFTRINKADFDAATMKLRGGSAPVDLTREGIANMPRADVVAFLAAHGVDKPSGKLSDLRDHLEAIVFVDL